MGMISNGEKRNFRKEMAPIHEQTSSVEGINKSGKALALGVKACGTKEENKSSFFCHKMWNTSGALFSERLSNVLIHFLTKETEKQVDKGKFKSH